MVVESDGVALRAFQQCLGGFPNALDQNGLEWRKEAPEKIGPLIA